MVIFYVKLSLEQKVRVPLRYICASIHWISTTQALESCQSNQVYPWGAKTNIVAIARFATKMDNLFTTFLYILCLI